MSSKSKLIPLVQKYRNEGLTVTQACKKAGLSVPTFYNHQRPAKKSEGSSMSASSKLARIDKNSIVVLVVPAKKAKGLLKRMASFL